MWKELLKSRISNLFIFQFYFILAAFSQHGGNAIITKHNLQTVTARTSFQHLLFDQNGLMYLATSDGIIVYNGISEQFIRNSENAVNHIVTSMIEDADKIIWLGCDDGQIFKILNNELIQWLPQEGLPKHKISKMIVDDKNQLWIATKGEGVYVYNHKYIYHFGIEDGLNTEDINDMHFSKHKGIIVSSDQGIQILNFRNEIKKVSKIDIPCIEANDIIQNLQLLGDHLYLNNLSSGIIQWNLLTDTCQITWSNSKSELATAFHVSKEYQVVFTEESMYLKSGMYDQLLSIQQKFIFSEIQSLVLDDNNTLWILHKNKGLLSIFLPVMQYEVAGKIIQSIAMSSDEKTLLLCTDSGLQIIRANDGKLVSSHFAGENLTSIYQDKHKDVFWLGSYGQGLIRFNVLTKESKRFKKEDGIPNNNILQIIGTDQFIWITTLGGIMRMDHTGNANTLNHLKIYDQDNGLPTNFIYQIAADPSDRLWIATDGNGIHFIDKDAYCIEPLYNSTSTLSIYNLEFNPKGVLYFNASRKGLGSLNIKRDSVVWIETSMKNFEYDGISLLNDSDLLTVGNGFIMLVNHKRALSITMDEEFGLTDLIPSLNAIYKDHHGIIWIGCKNTLIRVQPDILSILSRPWNSFNSIKVSNLSIKLGKDSIFKYDENQISFEFNAIHYLASDHLDFRYKLNGYDKEWVYSKEGNRSYSNLSPGKYQFVVQSSIDKNFDDSNEIDYSFEVLNPFWQRWWFVAICILGTILWFRYYVRKRESLKIKEEAIKRNTMALEFEILKSQVNPHFIFNSFNSVISLIEEDKYKAIEFTEKLSDYFRNILKYRDSNLIPLPEEMTILLNYIELLKIRHPDQIIFDHEISQANALIPPMTLQLLMENAIKHNELSVKHPLRISVYCKQDSIIFKNSILRKRTEVDSTGFGLDSIRFRYQLLTVKKIKIEVLNGYFSVEIPILHKQL